MDKRAKDKLVMLPRENGGGQDAQKDLHSRTRRKQKKLKTQEKMERVGGGQEKMEGHCSTGQNPSPQWAVVPTEEVEEEKEEEEKV